MDFCHCDTVSKEGEESLVWKRFYHHREAAKMPQNESRTGSSRGKQAPPTQRFGAGFEIRKLVAGGETKDHGAGAGLNIFFHPIDHLIPGAGNAKHRVCHRLVRPVVVLGKKGLSFDNSLFATSS